jgi:Tfp pilus assembly PilM family ATPase
MIRTGIDLGSASIKLARGHGSPQLERITHVGSAKWGPTELGDDVERAADGLRRLMRQLRLKARNLGHIAVAARGAGASLREVRLPTLTEEELHAALPFEARKHLDLESMESPLVASQILGPAEGEPANETGGLRALLVAVPSSAREFPLRVLGRLGLEPEVIDLEPLANLNALLGRIGAAEDGVAAWGLLHVGTHRATLQLIGRRGGFLSRTIEQGAPCASEGCIPTDCITRLVKGVRDTLVHYRGRYRLEVDRIYVSGVGVSQGDLAVALRAALGLEVAGLDPFGDLAEGARGIESLSESRANFVTACGLCRWWDETHV